MSPEPFTVITRVAIPASLPPTTVLAAIQTYEALITPNPYLDRYEQRPLDPNEIANDPLFQPDGRNPQAFTVYDRVPIIPGIPWATKEVIIPCVFQSFEHGARCRANAQAGVTVRSSYEVRRRGEVKEGPDLRIGPADGDHELVDISSIECSAVLKPFVKMRFSSAHQALLQQVIDDLMQPSGGQNKAAQAGSTAQ